MRSLAIIMILAATLCGSCESNQSKEANTQSCDKVISIEEQINIQQQDTTTISRAEIWLTFRNIYEDGLVKGLGMAESSYENFKNLTQACGVEWDGYLNGIFADGISQVDPFSTWKMLSTKGEVFSNIYFDRSDFKAACPIGFMYYVAGVDEGVRSGGAEPAAKEASLANLFLLGLQLREIYMNDVEPLFYEQSRSQ